jgi:hypothetical protein
VAKRVVASSTVLAHKSKSQTFDKSDYVLFSYHLLTN